MKSHFYVLFLFFVILSSCSPQQELTTTLTPARDLTGTWSGTAQFQENVPGAECLFEGTFTLILQQQNNVRGNFVFTETAFQQTNLPTDSLIPPIGCSGPVDGTTSDQVIGTISSSALTLQRQQIKQFSGSFTTDQLSLTLHECLVQFGDECSVEDNKLHIILTRN